MFVGSVVKEQVVVLDYGTIGVTNANGVVGDNRVRDADGASDKGDGRSAAYSWARDRGVQDLRITCRVEIHSRTGATRRCITRQYNINQTRASASIRYAPA